MKEQLIEQIIGSIDERYVKEANTYVEKRKQTVHTVLSRISRLAAGFALLFVMSAVTLTTAAAAGNIPAYDILYAIYPEMAQKLVPVQVSCEDNGIRMRVESVNIEGNMADIYISMTDLEGERIDETTDLFDSYNIHTSHDLIGNCTFVDYNQEQKQATFLLKLQHMNDKPISGRKLTFSVSKFLGGKQETERELSEISLRGVAYADQTQKGVAIRGMSGAGAKQLEITGFLCEQEEQSFSPAAGVTITAFGIVDGDLHVQAYYEDILNTDNHGTIYLKDLDGNVIHCNSSIAFWDEEKSGSYEEYVFDMETMDDTKNYSVWGYFHTCENLTTGDWEVTFPIR